MLYQQVAAGLIKFNTWLTIPNPFSIDALIRMYSDFIKHPLPPEGQHEYQFL